MNSIDKIKGHIAEHSSNVLLLSQDKVTEKTAQWIRREMEALEKYVTALEGILTEGQETFDALDQMKLAYNADKTVMRFTIPGRLPRRPKIEHDKYSFQYDRKAYVMALAKNFNRLLFAMKDDVKPGSKIRIDFVQHYDGETPLVDCDNLDVKPIIDNIALYLLPDDSPEYCSFSVTSLLDGQNCTEVYVRPVANNQ